MLLGAETLDYLDQLTQFQNKRVKNLLELLEQLDLLDEASEVVNQALELLGDCNQSKGFDTGLIGLDRVDIGFHHCQTILSQFRSDALNCIQSLNILI